jgi:integrase
VNPQEILDRSQLSGRSKATYRQSLDEWIAFAPNPGDWSPIALEAWRDVQLGQGYSPRTVNRHMSAVRFLGRRMKTLGLGPNFAQGAESAREGRRAGRLALTHDEALELFATCDDSPRGRRDRAVLALGLRLAMRVSELCRVEWAGVQRPVVGFIAKGGHWHEPVLDDEADRALSNWRRTSSKLEGRNLSDRVFRSVYYSLEDNRARLRLGITRKAIWKMVAARGRRARLARDIHPHLLRHTFVVWALEAGRPLNEIMAQTGHRSIKTLSNYVSDPNAASDPIGNHLPSTEI